MARKFAHPRAAPTQPSPRASALASLSTATGSPVASANRRPSGKPRQAGMFSGRHRSPPPGPSGPRNRRRRPPGAAGRSGQHVVDDPGQGVEQDLGVVRSSGSARGARSRTEASPSTRSRRHLGTADVDGQQTPDDPGIAEPSPERRDGGRHPVVGATIRRPRSSAIAVESTADPVAWIVDPDRRCCGSAATARCRRCLPSPCAGRC